MSHVPRHLVEAAIARVDTRIAGDSGALGLHVDRAQFLELLGRKNEALREYVAVLAQDPAHVEALNGLGLLMMGAGNREHARVLLASAVIHGPDHAAAHANLAYLNLLDGDLPAAQALYEHARQLDPTLATAHHGLADVAERCGDREAAARHRDLGLRRRPITIHRFTGEGRPIHLLALGSAAFGNVATDGFFDSRVFLLASVVVEYLDPTTPLPPHDLIFNAIGEGDLCAGPLATAAQIVGRTSAPVINHPSAVLATGRAANARRLGRLEGVVTPRIASFERSSLVGATQQMLAARGFRLPFLVRSPGYHTGEHFVKIDRIEALAPAIAALPGDELLVIEYCDVRDGDGDAHKFRAIIVADRLYPLHRAISRDWKVHYFSADMAERADHRAQDAAFLADMERVIGTPALAALHRIRAELALDYGGIDFGIDPHGNVIVFEANASMIVPAPDSAGKWDYRREPVARIHAAVRAMLVERARSSSASV